MFMHRSACFVPVPDNEPCVIKGTVRHRLWTNVVDITQKDGIQFQVERDQITGMSWQADATEYLLGRFLTGLVGVLVLVLPLLVFLAGDFRAWKMARRQTV